MNHYERDTDKFRRYYKWKCSLGWLTNNQCNLLHSLTFYTMFQVKILETSIEKPEGGRVQENSSSDRNIISPHLFLFSEMSLGSELTNFQGIYSNAEIHKIMYDLWLYLFFWYSGVFIGGTVQQVKTEYLMFHNVKTLCFMFIYSTFHTVRMFFDITQILVQHSVHLWAIEWRWERYSFFFWEEVILFKT